MIQLNACFVERFLTVPPADPATCVTETQHDSVKLSYDFAATC